MNFANLEAPKDDEIEVSIFGPGKGECVIAHLGNNDWIVVDSCVSRASKKPIALEYLESLGIPPDQAVKLIAVSHWHDDHIKGTSQIVRTCKDANFVCASALLQNEFAQFVESYSKRFMSQKYDSGTNEFAAITEQLFTEYAGKRPYPKRLIWAAANKRLVVWDGGARPFPVELYSLSPSDAAFSLAIAEFRKLMPQPGTPKRQAPSLSPNIVSAAFWIIAGNFNILLGGDLDKGSNRDLGWRAVIDSTARPSGRASIVKAPHHGAESGYYAPMWQKMTEPDAVSLIAPFSGGVRPLPSDKDIARIKKHTRKIFITADPKGWSPKRRDSAADKFSSTVVLTRRRVEGQMGHVCVRIPRGAKEMQIHLSSGSKSL